MKKISALMPKTILENFIVGMDRELREFKEIEVGEADYVLNLGAGNKDIIGAIPLDMSNGWIAPGLEYPDGSVAGVFAYHFLEHLSKDTFLKMLKEIERVLIPGGLVNIVVPYWNSELAYQDIDHKLFFSEKTFPNLLFNKYYDGTVRRDWKFRINAQVIMGIVHRNLCLLVQLEKEPEPSGE